MTPCLLGPRHGHIVWETPAVPFLHLTTGETKPQFRTGSAFHLYLLGRFELDDGSIREFYYWAGEVENSRIKHNTGATKEQAEKAVDNYIWLERREKHGSQWEHPWSDKPSKPWE